MFLKQEKPEMNDFEENKNFGSKGKTRELIVTLLEKHFKNVQGRRIPLQKCHKIFLHILLFQNIQNIFFIL